MADLARLNIAVNTRGARQQLGAFRTAMATTGKAVTFQINRIQGAFRTVTSAVFGLQGALAGVGVALGAGAVVNTTLRLDRLKTALSAVSGSSKETEKTLGVLRNMSNRLGIDFLTTAESFKNFSIASRASGMDAQLSNEIFEGFVTASSAMKLSSDDLSGALRALQQMISKGNVQAEELRGQLGERLPGAFAMSAEALGVTTQELNKMLDNGQVLATDLLPKLGKLMQERFAQPAEVASRSATAEFNRLGNAIDEVKITLGTSGLIGLLVALSKSVTTFIQGGGFVNLFESAVIGSAKLLDSFGAVAKMTENYFNSLKNMLTDFNDFTNGMVGQLGIIGFLLYGRRGLAGGVLFSVATSLFDKLLFEFGNLVALFFASSNAFVDDIVKKQRKDLIDYLQGAPLTTGLQTTANNLLASAGINFNDKPMGMLQGKFIDSGAGTKYFDKATAFFKEFRKAQQEQKTLDATFIGANSYATGGGTKSPFELFFEGASKGFDKLKKDITDFGKIGENVVVKAFGAMDSAVENFVRNGKVNMKQFAQDMLVYFAQVSARMAVITAFGALKPSFMSMLGLGGGAGAPTVTGMQGSMSAPYRAYGGQVTRGSPYIVGERGAELFVPNQSGRIVPNAGGSTIVNNYDFRGADRSAVAQLEMMAENIKQETFKMVFGSIEQGGRFAKATGRRA